MKAKIKLLLGGFGFAGANGIALPALNSSYSLFESISELDWGGHQLWQEINKTKTPKDSKLDLKTETNNLKVHQFGLSEELTGLHQVKLEVEKSLNSLSLDTFVQNKSDAEDMVKSIIGEIKAEEGVIELKSKSQEKYEQAVKQHLNGKRGAKETNLRNFQEVKKQIETWNSQRSSNKVASPISQKNRESLQKVYELYSKLSDEKDQLIEDLNAIKKLEDGYASRQVFRPVLSEIQSSLAKINWGKSKIKLTRQGGGGQKMLRNDWGRWANNPYRHFYDDESSYRKDISSTNGSLAKISREKQEIQRERAYWGWNRAVQSFDQREKRLNEMSSNVGSHIELQVAKKLLEHMNLLAKKKT